MKISAKVWLLLGVIFFNWTICSAQYSITGDATQTINFTSYTGTGFSPGAATTGSLDSNTWGVDLDDNGTMDSDFGDTNTAGIYANNASASAYNAGNWPPGSFQAYTYNGVNRLGVRNGFTGHQGDIGAILRLQNNTGGDITSWDIEYDLQGYVGSGTAAEIEFYYSADNSSYTQVAGLGTSYSNPSNMTAAAITLTGTANTTISDGAYYYLKWVWREHDANAAAIAIIDIDITATIAAGSGEGTITAGTTNFGDFSSTSTTDPGEDILDFTITDDASTGADAFPIQFTDVVFNKATGDGTDNWSDVIAGARLEDSGGNAINATAVTSNTIVFSSIGITSSDVGYVPDDGSETFTLSVWLNTSISEEIDRDLLQVSVAGSDFTFSGATSTITLTESASSNALYNTIEVVGTNWGFEEPPTTVGLLEDFGLTIISTDASGNIDLDDNSSTFILSRGSTGANTLTESGASYAALTAKTLTAGRYSYSDLRYDVSENFNIDVDDSGGSFLTSITSSDITAAISYQTAGSGNWTADFATIWEFWDGTGWQTAITYPSATTGTIYIRSGHDISVDADITADQVVIESGGTISMDQNGDVLTLADGPGVDLSVESGGIWDLSDGNAIPVLTGTAQIQSGGMFSCSNTNALDDIAESTQIEWQTDAVLYYTATGDFPYNTDFFPATATGIYPILEVDGATGDPGLWSLNGILKVSSGTFTIDGGNGVTIRDGFLGDGNIILDNGANFTYTGGTLFLGGSGSLDLDTRSLSFSSTIIELQSDKEVFNGTFSIDGTSTVNGYTFSLNDGTNNNLNLTIADGAIINSNATTGLAATLAAEGTLTIGNEVEYNFEGASGQTLNFGTIGVTEAGRVTVNNSSGVILNSNLTINERLTLTSGVFSTSSSSEVITITSSAIIVGASSTNYFDGPLEVQGISSSYTFHVGDGAVYRPVIISPVSSSNVAIEFFNSNPPDNTSVGTGLASEMASLYWEIQRGSGTGDVAVELFYKESTSSSTPDNDQILDGTHLKLIQYNNGTSTWEDLGLDANNSDLANLSSITGTISSFIGASDYHTIGTEEGNTLLPVELISLTGTNNVGVTLIEWATASELNNDRFEIERSGDGQNFQKIGMVNGHGTVNTLKTYSFSDTRPLRGYSYYRLKQVDYDGSSALSQVISVLADDSFTTNYLVYPNPVQHNLLNVKTGTVAEGQSIYYKITNLEGKDVMSVEGFPEFSETKTLFLPELESGQYILIISSGSQNVSVPFIKN
ncbi:MAG: T9SS type A sorting domain-containing protein [Reichenbachiella sp.]|uniref:T9SS type A sorting domain-containing protein n=3 Tax=Reichenbachiella sp. TaxID=2184521 RepID=UPI00326639DB